MITTFRRCMPSLLCLVILVGCSSSPRFNVAEMEDVRTEVERLEKLLPPEQAVRLRTAALGLAVLAAKESTSEEEAKYLVASRLDGKTPARIIAEFEKLTPELKRQVAQLIQVGDKAKEMACSNNLKAIGLALLYYHDTYRRFPPAYIPDKDGTPMHSWRAILLPFLGEYDAPAKDAYAKYRWDEPWNSPNNLAATKGVSIYSCPLAKGTQGETNYVVIMDSRGVFNGSEQSRLADVLDGVRNTIAVVESHGTGIHWAEPRDFELRTLSLPLKGHSADGCNVLTCAGEVRIVGSDVSWDLIEALVTRAGGETIPFNALDGS